MLECGEIFDLRGEDLSGQNAQLLADIQQLDPDLPRTESEIECLGLGNWSNVLYFDLNDAG